MSLIEADDFLAECASCHRLLVGIAPADWTRPTAFKGWDAIDIIGHLHLADHAAAAALDGSEAFTAAMAGFRGAVEARESGTSYTRRWHGERDGSALLDRWWRFANILADRYATLDPKRRVPWGRGPDMSARSCMSARQMEVWAHGQALFDLFGVEREEHDRLRNIAMLGVNTFGWAFRNRGLPIPDEPPFLSLTAPSGAIWSWNDARSGTRIEGSAVDFCRVVTQARNVRDSALVMTGDVAHAWMKIAQCFAGPPHDPPRPGQRLSPTLNDTRMSQ